MSLCDHMKQSCSTKRWKLSTEVLHWFIKTNVHLTVILWGHAGYEVTGVSEVRTAQLVIIILYPANRSRRIMVLLKMPGSNTLPCWFYSGPIWLLLAICSHSCKDISTSLYCWCFPWPYYVQQNYLTIISIYQISG